jgi:hypothetical protein
MKRIVIILGIFSSLSLFSQTTRVLSQLKIGDMDCTFQQTITAKTGDTSMVVSIKFKNTGYKSDVRTITFEVAGDTSDISQFDRDLKSAVAGAGTNINQGWDEYEYTVKIFDFNDKVYLFEGQKSGDRHTELAKRDAQRLLGWIEGDIKNIGRFKKIGRPRAGTM